VTDLPADFTLLQVTPELETGGAEQTTIDVAHAVVAQGGKALVATKGGRMAARLEADGGRLAQMPAQSKNPLVMLGNAARLIDLIRREKVSLVHAARAPRPSAPCGPRTPPRSRSWPPITASTTPSPTSSAGTTR
jgi:hypothetical protein